MLLVARKAGTQVCWVIANELPRKRRDVSLKAEADPQTVS